MAEALLQVQVESLRQAQVAVVAAAGAAAGAVKHLLLLLMWWSTSTQPPQALSADTLATSLSSFPKVHEEQLAAHTMSPSMAHCLFAMQLADLLQNLFY